MQIWLLGSEDPSIDIDSVFSSSVPGRGPSSSTKSKKVDAGNDNGNGKAVSDKANGSTNATDGKKVGDIASTNGGAVARWRAYMESYVLHHPTELVSEDMRGNMQKTFLNRCVVVPRFFRVPIFLDVIIALLIFAFCFFILPGPLFRAYVRIIIGIGRVHLRLPFIFGSMMGMGSGLFNCF